ncbi:Uncharacterised protein [Mycobacterium tuberculosis]|nr:Uncharacterised protein [Mycobacterium tuberculosis]
MTGRATLRARLAALEAGRPGAWPFVVASCAGGRRCPHGLAAREVTVSVPFDAVLNVFMDAGQWIHPDGDEAPAEPLGKWTTMLGHAVRTPDKSLLAVSVVALARAARETGDGT